MNGNLRILVSGLVALSALAAATAAAPKMPTSRPATRPATRSTSRPALAPPAAFTDRDSVEVKSEKYKLSFRVPKTWEKANVSITGGEAEMYQYGRPLPKPVRLKGNALPPPPTPDQYVSLIVGKPCHAGTTLADLAKESRDGIVAHEGHPVDLLRDAADTIAGRPAWRIDYPFDARATGWKLVDGAPVAELVKIKSVRRELVWLHGDSFCQLDFVSDQASEAAMTRVLEQITGSIKEID